MCEHYLPSSKGEGFSSAEACASARGRGMTSFLPFSFSFSVCFFATGKIPFCFLLVGDDGYRLELQAESEDEMLK